MKKIISIISPVYNEEGNINNFYTEIDKVTKKLSEYDFEIILINDGSKDRSLELLIALTEKDNRVKVLNFSRNFGHQSAITAGIDYSREDTDAIVILDSDLQDPPHLIFDLVKKWENGFEIVDAKKKSRKDGFVKDNTAKLFYRLLNLLLVNKIPEDVGDFRLVDKKAVRILKKLPEKDRYLRGLSSWIGFKHGQIEFDRDVRAWGKTNYTFKKMFNLAKNAIFSFSDLPLKLPIFISLISLILSIMCFMARIVKSDEISLYASIFFFYNFLTFLVLAILFEYIGRIYRQSIDRPIYIVSDVYSKK